MAQKPKENVHWRLSQANKDQAACLKGRMKLHSWGGGIETQWNLVKVF